jgi:DNA polymerase-4
MRTSGRVGRTVVLRLRFDDYSAVTRSHTMRRPTASSAPVLAAARALLARARPIVTERGLTQLGITVANHDGEDSSGQLQLPLDDPPDTALDDALDAVRDRVGPTAVTRASLIGRDPGLAAWLAPEGRRRGRAPPR